MRRATLVAALAALLLAAGCESMNPLRWFGVGGTPAHEPTPLAPITASVNARAAWTAAVGKSAGLQLRPVVEGGRLYAAAADGGIAVLDPETGRLANRIETKKPIAGGLAFGAGHLYAGTLKGEAFAVDASGKVTWGTSLAGEIIAPPAQSRNVVVFRTSDGRIFGLSAADGKRLWVYQRPTPALLLRSAAGVIATGGDVLAGYANGKLIALDIDDGKLTWEVTVALPRGATELERIADIAGLPVIDGQNVCAAAFQGKVACFEIPTRNMVWSQAISSSRALVTDARNLYIVDDNGAVHALDKKTGASVWKQDKLEYRKLSSPVVFGGKVVVGDGYGFLHVLSPDDGSLVGRLQLDKSEVVSLVPAGEALIAQTTEGTVASVRF